MLEKLRKLACFLKPLNIFVLIGIPVFGVLFVMNILEMTPVSDPDYLIPISVGLLWSLLLFSFIGSFQEIPQRAKVNQKFLKRIKARWIRGVYWLLALVTLLTSVGVVVITFRLLSVWV